MLLRDAVCPPPHLPAVVRVAGAVAVLTAFVIVGAVIVCGDRRQMRVFPEPPPDRIARNELAAYVKAYPAWVIAHPDRVCPDRLRELNDYLPMLDPWGMPYQFLCGAQHGVAGLKMRSAGPDRTFDTTDDLRR